MTFESQEQQIRKSREALERSAEIREAKEGEVDQEVKAAAAMERADFLVKEVKQNKQQMQNIFLHMQTVLATIKQLRNQLQLLSDEKPDSVKQDEKQIEKLKTKIAEHREEIIKMKDDLIQEYMEEMRSNGVVEGNLEEIKNKAEQMVGELLREVEEKN